MDYGDLLLEALKNDRESSKEENRCYKTTLGPPKKLKNKGVSPENVQKFLSRRKEEERKKREDLEGKKAKLLALRSEKRARRTRKKIITPKEAVIEEFKQCDEDDYGFVSKESSDIYAEILNKYMTDQQNGKWTVSDVGDKGIYKVTNTSPEQINIKKEKDDKKSEETINVANLNKEPFKPRKDAPPPISFIDLLEIAKKKQFEPIIIKEPTKCEKRPMSKREKLDSQLMSERGKQGSNLVTKESNKSNSIIKERLQTFRSMSEKEKLDLYQLVQKAKIDRSATTSRQNLDARPMLEGAKPQSLPKISEKESETKCSKEHLLGKPKLVTPNLKMPHTTRQAKEDSPTMAKGAKLKTLPMKEHHKTDPLQLVKQRKRQVSTEFRSIRAMAKSFFYK